MTPEATHMFLWYLLTVFGCGCVTGAGIVLLIWATRSYFAPRGRHAPSSPSPAPPTPTTVIPRVLTQAEVDEAFSRKPRLKDQQTALHPYIQSATTDWRTIQPIAAQGPVPPHLESLAAWKNYLRTEGN